MLVNYQFVIEETLQEPGPVSQDNEEERFRLLSQVVNPAADPDSLVSVISRVPDLDLTDRQTHTFKAFYKMMQSTTIS